MESLREVSLKTVIETVKLREVSLKTVITMQYGNNSVCLIGIFKSYFIIGDGINTLAKTFKRVAWL